MGIMQMLMGAGSTSIEATGGTKVTDGSYTYHVFLSPGSNFTVSASEGEVEYVVVAWWWWVSFVLTVCLVQDDYY